MEGRLLHINQGEFYIYRHDGGSIDTIRVDAGRFAYETTCNRPTTLLLIFPNFTEQPIFAQPGKSVDIKGDASHLKEMSVKGTKDNELMNAFREQTASASPPEIVRQAQHFVEDHPESPVSTYIVNKYFIQGSTPDYQKARRLVDLMVKAQEDNGALKRLQQRLKGVAATSIGQKLPAFSTHDVYGKNVTLGEVATAEVAVISVWASWDYESQTIQRQLKQWQRQSKGRLKLFSISLDPSIRDCMEFIRRDSISWPNVCDERMLEGRLYQQLGFSNMPDNIVLQNGRIVARGLKHKDLKEKIEKMI